MRKKIKWFSQDESDNLRELGDVRYCGEVLELYSNVDVHQFIKIICYHIWDCHNGLEWLHDSVINFFDEDRNHVCSYGIKASIIPAFNCRPEIRRGE